MDNKVRTIYMGSGEFAVLPLLSLAENEAIDLIAVITQPDKPAGRKKILTPTPVKAAAEKLKVRIIQPVRLKEEQTNLLSELNPDLIVVADYGQILPAEMIDYPRFGCINIHASLLPKYRGAVPIEAAILAGDAETGVSFMKMTPGLDDGPVLDVVKTPITQEDTGQTLTTKLSKLAADNINSTLAKWFAGKIMLQEQDHSRATFAPKTDLAKDKAELRFETDVNVAERMIRAFNPWPVAWLKINRGGEKRLKVFSAAIVNKPERVAKGFMFFKEGKELFLVFKDGVFRLDSIQLEGMKRAGGKDYLFLAEE